MIRTRGQVSDTRFARIVVDVGMMLNKPALLHGCATMVHVMIAQPDLCALGC